MPRCWGLRGSEVYRKQPHVAAARAKMASGMNFEMKPVIKSPARLQPMKGCLGLEQKLLEKQRIFDARPMFP